MFKGAAGKIGSKLKDAAIEAGPALVLGITIFTWGNAEFERQSYMHRD